MLRSTDVRTLAVALAAAAPDLDLLDSPFFKIVLALERNFPKPFFSFSWGTEGPACAWELMVAILMSNEVHLSVTVLCG